MKTLVHLLLASGCLVAANCSAGTIYEFVDYPELQNGYSLSGTIEVADTAADDGLLAVEEILDWSWFADGSQPFRGDLKSEIDFGATRTWSTAVEIDSLGVYLRAEGQSMFFLRSYQDTGPNRIPWLPRLVWRASDSAIEYSLFVFEYDYEFDVWSQKVPLDSTEARWLIARRIPEPTASLLAAAGIFGGMARRTVADRM